MQKNVNGQTCALQVFFYIFRPLLSTPIVEIPIMSPARGTTIYRFKRSKSIKKNLKKKHEYK